MSPDVGDRERRGQTENWKARRAGGVDQLWPWSENASDTLRDLSPGSRGGSAWEQPPPASPAATPTPAPRTVL